MEKQQFNGYFAGQLPVKMGDMVTLPKGGKFHSTKPGGREQVSKRARTIKVHSVDQGCASYTNHRGEVVPARNPRIVWVGGGGYWCDADLNELVGLPKAEGYNITEEREMEKYLVKRG